MQIGKIDNNIFIQLKMSAFHHTFTSHHIDKALIPLPNFFLFIIRNIIFRDNLFIDSIDIQFICPDNIFDLPHIEQILSDIFFPFLAGYNHISKFIRRTNKQFIFNNFRIYIQKSRKTLYHSPLSDDKLNGQH